MKNLMKRNASASSFSGLADRILQNTFNNMFDDDFWGMRAGASTPSVPVNIRETDKSFEVELAAPGLKKEDFKININRDVLSVSFERKEENKEENKDEGWLKREFYTQSFSRSFNLDDTIDANKISAAYTDGVLHLTLPKKEGARQISRSIEIQ